MLLGSFQLGSYWAGLLRCRGNSALQRAPVKQVACRLHEISTCVGASGQDRKWPKRVAPSQRLKLRNLCVVRARVSQELKPLGVQSFECECCAVHIAGQRVMRDSSRCAAWQFVQSSQAGSNDTYCQEVRAVQLEQWQDCLAATRLAAKKSKNHASLFRTTSSIVATPEYKVWE